MRKDNIFPLFNHYIPCWFFFLFILKYTQLTRITHFWVVKRIFLFHSVEVTRIMNYWLVEMIFLFHSVEV